MAKFRTPEMKEFASRPPEWLPDPAGLATGKRYMHDGRQDDGVWETTGDSKQPWKRITRLDKQQGPSIGEQMLAGGIPSLAEAPFLLMSPSGGIVKKGLKVAGEMLLPVAAEIGMQKAGMVPKSTADLVAAGLIPPAVRGAFATPGVARGATRGAAGFLVPQATREAGVDLFQKGFAAAKQSDPIFKIIRAQGPMDTRPLGAAVATALAKEAGMATPNRPALKLLKDLGEKFKDGTGTYDDVLDEIQRLRTAASGAFKRGNDVTGKSLNDAAASMFDTMDASGPTIKKANSLFRREQSVLGISKELRKSNPGVGIRNLFENDKLIGGSFSAAEQKDILDIADRISRIATGATIGAGNRLIMATAEPLAEAMQETAGRALLKMVMKNPRTPNEKARLLTIMAAQFARGSVGRTDQ